MLNLSNLNSVLIECVRGRLKTIGYEMWREGDGNGNFLWVTNTNNNEIVQSLIDDFAANVGAESVAWTLANKIVEIDEKAKAVREAFVDTHQPNASIPEMVSWPIKAAQARAWVASQDDSVAPLVVAEAEARGTDVATVANRICVNADALESAEAQIAGNAGKLKDAVRVLALNEPSLAVLEAIALVDVSIGWLNS